MELERTRRALIEGHCTNMISSLVFRGKSGQGYRFQAWPMHTKFAATGGVYIVTSRTFEDRTFRTKATHTVLTLGQRESLAEPLFTTAELSGLNRKGANCICVCAVADAEQRAEIEKDLLEENQRFGKLLYLFR